MLLQYILYALVIMLFLLKKIFCYQASHMKKLVQRSHGLMTKGKRLSVSAGDLLGKTVIISYYCFWLVVYFFYLLTFFICFLIFFFFFLILKYYIYSNQWCPWIYDTPYFLAMKVRIFLWSSYIWTRKFEKQKSLWNLVN